MSNGTPWWAQLGQSVSRGMAAEGLLASTGGGFGSLSSVDQGPFKRLPSISHERIVQSPQRPPEMEAPPVERRLPYGVSETGRFDVDVRTGDGPDRWVALHRSEPVATRVADTSEGTAPYYKISGGGKRRNITAGGLRVDPNRIWTAQGAEDHIKKMNKGAPKRKLNAAIAEAAAIRSEYFKQFIPKEGGSVYSFHNSRAGAVYSGGKNIYQHERDKKVTAEVHEGNENSPSFMIMTDQEQFDSAREQGAPFNILYQPYNPAAKDDGSLSYAMGKIGVPYVNLEVRLGPKAEVVQRAMLKWLRNNGHQMHSAGTH